MVTSCWREWMEKSRGLSISWSSRDKTPRKATLQLAMAHRTDGPNIRRPTEAHWGPPGRSAAPPTNENCIQSWQDFWKFCCKRKTVDGECDLSITKRTSQIAGPIDHSGVQPATPSECTGINISPVDRLTANSHCPRRVGWCELA